MKRLFYILLLLASPLYATTYYANGLTSHNINYTTAGAGWYPVQGASCVATGTPVAVGSFANGDVLNVNGCTFVAVNVDPGAATGASAGVCGTVTVTVTLMTDATNGGSFTYATATNLVIHTNVSSTESTALSTSGSTGGGTICGNITGGSTSSSVNGINDGHTSVTFYVIGNIFGGSSAGTAYGYSVNGTGPLNITGNATAGSSANSYGIYDGTAAVVTMTGSCVASSTVAVPGCYSSASGTSFTLIGNIINSLKGGGQIGPIFYAPSTTNYVLYPKDASYTLGTVDSHATLMCLLSGSGTCAGSGGTPSHGYAY